MRRPCRAIAHGGGPCQAPPLRDADYCRMHSPEHVEAVAEARRLGGQRRRREVTLATAYDLDGIHSVEQIQRVLEIAILGTLELENSVARNRTLGSLAQAALKAHETGDLQAQLDELRELLDQRKATGMRR